MKKKTNISILKELVNNNVIERVELCTSGVQAYNIAEGEEYTVLVAYTKQGGRYYFVARDGRRFLASRYDRAEFVAGEMLEVIANDHAAAMHAADQVEASGSVLVCADLLPLFFDECDRRNINVTSTVAGFDDLGRMLTRNDLVKDAEPAQQSNNNEDNNDNSEGDQTIAEPSQLAQLAEKVAEKVKTYTTRAAFAVILVAVCVLCFAFFGGCMSALGPVFDAVGIEGGSRIALSIVAIIPVLDVTLWIELNALAVLGRLFPGMFQGSAPRFIAPCSIISRVFRACVEECR